MCAKLGVDLADLLFAINVWLIYRIDPSASAVVAPGAEFTIDPAVAPQGLMDDPFPLLSGRIFYQY